MKPNMHYVCVMDYDEADTCLVAACRSEENASNIYDMLSTEYDMLWWDVLSDRPSLPQGSRPCFLCRYLLPLDKAQHCC